MASSIYGMSAYQQTSSSWTAEKQATSGKYSAISKTAPEKQTASAGQAAQRSSATETKAWNPLLTGSSLIPKNTTEYGTVIGDVKLSDKAKDYYGKLKEKFGNANFILVSKDMKNLVQQNAASYGNAQKMVVLIDEEKLERMATDESYRKKYEGIIAMSQTKLANAKSSLASTGASLKSFGMSVDSDGNESFFATVGKSLDIQRERIESKRAEKKAAEKAEAKKQEKLDRQEQIEKRREENRNALEAENGVQSQEMEYTTFEANSVEELLSSVSTYASEGAWLHTVTEAEKALGQHIDFKG